MCAISDVYVGGAVLFVFFFCKRSYKKYDCNLCCLAKSQVIYSFNRHTTTGSRKNVYLVSDNIPQENL